MRQLGDGPHGRQLHLFVDGGGVDVQRAAEDEWEAEDVIDLVGIVRPSRADHGVGPGLLGHLRHDLGIGIGERQDQWLGSHLRQHFGLQRAGSGQAQEHVGAVDDFGKRGGFAGAAELAAPFVIDVIALVRDQPILVRNPDVLMPGAQRDEHVEAGNGRGPCPGRADLDVADLLASQFQPIEHRCADDDRGAVLVVVEDRDRHALAQVLLDFETIGGANILKIDAAKGRPEWRDRIDELLRIDLVDLEIEHINASELLEEDRLAFHHRLGSQSADISEAQHGRAIRNDRHQVLA